LNVLMNANAAVGAEIPTTMISTRPIASSLNMKRRIISVPFFRNNASQSSSSSS
jgi:hypothetical protein